MADQQISLTHRARSESETRDELRLEPEHHPHPTQPLGTQGGRGERAGGERPQGIFLRT